MGIISSIRGALTLTKETTAVNDGVTILRGLYGSRFNTTVFENLKASERADALRNLEVIAICVRAIAQPLSQPRVQLVKLDGETKEAVPWETSPFSAHERLFHEPSPSWMWRQWMEVTITNLCLMGSIYNRRVISGGAITEFQPLRPFLVKEKWGKSNQELMGYRLYQDTMFGKYEDIPADKVASYWCPDPKDYRKSISPLDMALRSAQLDQAQQSHLGEVLKNMKMPGVIVATKKQAGPKERKAIEDKWSDKLQDGEGQVMVIDGTEVEIITKSALEDLDMPGLAGLNETRVASIFGVPAVIAGLREGIQNSPYSKMETAREMFFEDTLKPTWALLSEYLTRSLIDVPYPQYMGRYCLEFDASEMAQLHDSLMERIERGDKLWQSGLASRNEARVIAGLPEIAGRFGEVFRVPMGAQEVAPMDMEEAPEEPEPIPGDDGFDVGEGPDDTEDEGDGAEA